MVALHLGRSFRAVLPVIGFFSSGYQPFVAGSVEGNNSPDYLIVGAGGAGLQMALFLEKFDLSYRILEKTSVVGSHFSKFPMFDELISINKWHRNETQRLRYDWHTLLEAPLRMYDITQDYFPKGVEWHAYMTQVAQQAGIMPKIEFGVTVDRVADNSRPCLVLSDGTERCARRRIFMGTGLQEKNQILLEAIGGIPYSKVTTKMAKNRRVCILGNGNSGFEVAQNVFKVADRVTIYGRHPVRLSSVTRYTGDVRVKYLQILENLNMKLLDTVDSFVQPPKEIHGLEDLLTSKEIETVQMVNRIATWTVSQKCERLFLTTGFESCIPQGLTMGEASRFPASNDWYQSPDNPTVHYIGWLMHERDFRQSAGGFLSGFRYLIRNLAFHIRQEDAGVPCPVEKGLSKEETIKKVIARIQTADDLFILQDGVAIRDVIVPNHDDDTYHYYEGITHDFYPEIMSREDIVSVYFSWGKGRTVDSVFDSVIRYSDTQNLINVLLHPVVQVGKDKIRGIVEDLELEWVGSFADAVGRTVRSALDGDISEFVTKQSFPYRQATRNQTEFDYYEVPDNRRVKMNEPLIQALWKAVYSNGRKKEVEDLQMAARRYLPALFEGLGKEAPYVIE